MSRATRLGLVAGALVVGVVAFALLRPSDEDGSRPAATDRPAPESERPSRPELPVLSPGAVRTIEVRRGERVRFAVRSPKAEEVHVHGYDLLKHVPAGGGVRFNFPVEFEGQFEIELEQSREQIGNLVVTP